MIGYRVALVIAVIILIAIVLYKRKNTTLNGIILLPDQSIDVSPNFKIFYKQDGDVCVNYRYNDSNLTHCEPILKPPDKSYKHFINIDRDLIFNSYVGDPNSIFYMTGTSGFGIGFLADKIAQIKPEAQNIIYNDIVNSLHSQIV
jgi:hypothetical protein